MDANGEPLQVAATSAVGALGGADTSPNPFAAVTHVATPDLEEDTVIPEGWQGTPSVESDDVAGDDEQAGAELTEAARNIETSPEPAAAVDIQVATPDEAFATGDRPATSVRPKPSRKKKSSPIKTLIGVALGPVLALPLAGAILLALGRAPDLGFWPFDGSYNNATQKRSAAPPSNTDSSFTNPNRQEPQTLSPKGSLLDDGSDVAQAVKEITGDPDANAQELPESTDDSRSSITDLNQVSDPVANRRRTVGGRYR